MTKTMTSRVSLWLAQNQVDMNVERPIILIIRSLGFDIYILFIWKVTIRYGGGSKGGRPTVYFYHKLDASYRWVDMSRQTELRGSK